MNFIAYDAAYSLFPKPTFKERESLIIGKNMSETNPTLASALAKYREGGGESDPFSNRLMNWQYIIQGCDLLNTIYMELMYIVGLVTNTAG